MLITREELEKYYHSDEEIKLIKKRAAKILPERVEYYAEIIGVTFGRISIRHQRTVWGSCSSKGNLNLNCMLILMPPKVCDYVIIHELCHRKYMNHSQAFWNEVKKYCPDYKLSYDFLKENGYKYIR